MCKFTTALIEVIGKENSENLVNAINRVKERAVERHTQQSVEVVFDNRGDIFYINGSDNIRGTKPVKYAPE